MKSTKAIGIALILGIFAGLLPESFINIIKIPGDIFILSLKMMIMPIIFISMVKGMLDTGKREFGRIGFYTLIYYISTTLIAVAIGIFLVNIIKPGLHSANIITSQKTFETMTFYSFLQIQLKKMLQNPFKALSEGRVLGVIVFSIFFGIGLTRFTKKDSPTRTLIFEINNTIMWMVDIIMYMAPLGVFSLMAFQISKSGIDIFKSLFLYMLTVVLGLAIHAFFVLLSIARIFGAIGPGKLFLSIKEPLMVALATSSSAATLPVTMRAAREKLCVKDEVAGLVLPLGATINMDGTALYEAVAAIFIAQHYGIFLGLDKQILVFLTATLAAIGAAGIPSAGTVTMAMVLTAVGLPLEGIGMILAVDRILDMLRTSVNVLGDLVGSRVIDQVSTHFNRLQ